MFGSLLLAMLLFFGMLAGGAAAGEDDYLAMRGKTDDGKTQVNSFQASWNAESKTLAKPAARTESGVLLDMGLSRSYLQWKNNCVAVPPVVEGRLLDLGDTGGFDLVAPYTGKQEPAENGYIKLLSEELGGG